jgi:hypothetical protein
MAEQQRGPFEKFVDSPYSKKGRHRISLRTAANPQTLQMALVFKSAESDLRDALLFT